MPQPIQTEVLLRHAEVQKAMRSHIELNERLIAQSWQMIKETRSLLVRADAFLADQPLR